MQAPPCLSPVESVSLSGVVKKAFPHQVAISDISHCVLSVIRVFSSTTCPPLKIFACGTTIIET